MSEQHQSVLLNFLRQRIIHPIKDIDDQQTISSHTTISTNTPFSNSVQQLNETMDILMDGIEALSEDTQRLSVDSLHYQTAVQSVSEEIVKVKAAIEETYSVIDAHKTSQQMLEQSIASLQQQVTDQQNVSYDGTLLWKITNFQQKLGMFESEYYKHNRVNSDVHEDSSEPY